MMSTLRPQMFGDLLAPEVVNHKQYQTLLFILKVTLILKLKWHEYVAIYIKNSLSKTKGFHKHESSLCHKHAVTMLTQPGLIDVQLKEQLKSQMEENRNCLLKNFQSISYLSHQGIALH